MKSKLLIVTIVSFCLCSTLLAQSGSDISTAGNINSNVSTQRTDEPSIQPNLAGIQNNSETDEYGELQYNGYLTGLNGTGNYVNVPTNAVFNQNFDGSMEMWVYPLSVTGTKQLIGKGTSSNVQFIWGITGNLQYFRIGTTSVINTGGTGIPVNQWTHLAVTWTGGNPFSVNFYVNGALSGAPQVLNNAWTSNLDPIKIGGPSGGFSGEFFNGYIDEVRFWDTERTLAQFRDNRFVGIGDGANANSSNALVGCSTYNGLLASWNFNRTGTAPDYVGGFNGTFVGTAYSQQSLAGAPIPYNFVLRCPGTGGFSRVDVPHNTTFNQYTDGTLEAWIYTTVNNQTKEIIAKGNTSPVSFIFGMSSNGKLFMRIGAVSTVNNDGITIPVNQWTHVACVWLVSSSAFLVTFYVNGQPSGTQLNNTGTFTQNTNPLTIGGGIAFPGEGWSGYIDEVRFWSDQKSQAVLRANMFGSVRGLTSSAGLIGAWNFDGNLLNRAAAVTGINGSFNNGGTNDCRLSGFLNETSSGAPGLGFLSHTTVVNRSGSGNPFPGGFAVRAPLKPILDLQTTRDTVYISGAAIVSAVEVFVSIRHTWLADLNITLVAPNGQPRDLTSGNGGSGDNILTFFVDGGTSVTNSSYLPPWSNTCAPEQTMGTFGGSPTQGGWILSVADVAGGDQGALLGWGVRLNNSITSASLVSGNIPVKYALYQNYPNPFNPVTNIKFDIAKSVNVKLVVYDILGEEVKSLIDEYTKAGQYEIRFDASDIASGTYFYKLVAGDFTDVKKLVVIK